MDALPIVLVVIAVGIVAWLSQRSRKKLDEYRRQLEQQGEYLPPEPRQKLTRAQRRVEEFRASVPPPPPTSIEEIARAEAAELGLDEIPGASDLPVDVQLLVWRRDGDIRDRCDGTIRYALDPDVEPSAATADDVRIECDGELLADADDSGNNVAG